jgi:uncharacterized membrane protein
VTHEPRWYRSPSVVFAAAALGFIVVVQIVLGRGSSSPPSEFTLFLGRFHPLVVHLPIGVLVLVGLAEAATFFPRYRPRIDPALGLALPALVVVTVTAFVLGHFLGRSGGYAARALSTHQKLEFLAAVTLCLSAALWARQTSEATPAARNVYRGSLFLTLLLLSVGAHFSGTVTHGDSYLTEYAPGPFRSLLGGKERAPAASGSAKSAPPKAAAEPLVFADVVAPLLQKYCVDCHGPKKQKGKLRLDSMDAMSKGGEDGPALVAGSSATSELIRRIRLPKDDDDRMPPEGKAGPTPEELAVLAFWIDRGASPTLKVRDTLAPTNGRKLLEAAVGKAPKVPSAVTSGGPTPAPPPAASGTEPAASESKSAAEPKPSAEPAHAAPKPERESEPEPESANPKKDDSAKATQAPATSGGRAVLADKCEKCHGSAKHKGGLRVDSVAALVAGGENGAALVPGNPERSEMIRRVRLPVTAKEHMPPKKEPQLSDGEVAALVAWVRGLSNAKVAASESAKSKGAGANAEASTASPSESTPSESAPSETAPAAGENAERASARAEIPPDAAEASGPPDAALLARVPASIAVYQEAVAPVLSKRCSKCHSGKKPAARLHIDEYATLVEGGLSGPGIVPGKPDDSLVCQRISLPASDDDHMPPADEPSMTADEIALVRFWVERGASPTASLPAKDFPAPALRAAAEHTGAQGPAAAIHGGGCGACALGAESRSSVGAFAWAALVLGAFFYRRRLTRRA